MDFMVIYGLGVEYQGNIICVYLKVYMFYNIYCIKGLLSIFIVNLALFVIEVVLYLVIIKVLYFVVKGDGSYQFFIILEEYQKVVCQFQW